MEFTTHSFMVPGCSVLISAAIHPSPFLQVDFPGGKATSLVSIDSERTQLDARICSACSRFVVPHVWHASSSSEEIYILKKRATMFSHIRDSFVCEHIHAWVIS